MRHYISLLFYLSLISVLCAQVSETFADGDFTTAPTWVGDTSHFRINSNGQLQLDADSAGSSQLAMPYTVPQKDTLTWEFWLKLSFVPSGNNYAMVALYADSADLLNCSHYLALAVTDPTHEEKEMTLYLDDAEIYTFPFKIQRSTNPLRVKVQLVQQTTFQCWIDTAGSTDTEQYQMAGSLTTAPVLLDGTGWFGIYCRYTASRAHNFYLDDIFVNRSATADPGQPALQQVKERDIVINEILFNPHPGGVDYVELYNRSDSAIVLSTLALAQWRNGVLIRLYPLGEGQLAPHDYLVLTTDGVDIQSRYTVPYPEKVKTLTTMPAYNDDSGTVMLTRTDTLVIDRFDYHESMHSALLRDPEGVALERRSTEAPTQEAANWYSAASTAGYGTPTARNSQSREWLYVEDDFLVEPALFSPDGDGYEDLLNITYRLVDCSLSANLSVYDSRGRLVRHLLRGALLGCEGALVWDGLDDEGQRCRQGQYLIVIEAYNSHGRRQKSRKAASLYLP